MNIIRTIDAMREWRQNHTLVAFVPTMGNLHAGHMALVKAAKDVADNVIVSIFVNPLQFGANEDIDTYPRTLEADCEKLRAAGVSALFTPALETLYPQEESLTYVLPPAIRQELCGVSRPIHFRGVATVVAKLFNIIQPQVACFGKKDYQQLHIIQKMVEDLNFPVKIIPVDTGRAPSGLALSSRNAYLTESELHEAPRLYHHLSQLRAQILAGNTDFNALVHSAQKALNHAGWSVDYIEVRNAHTLAPAQSEDVHLVILAAAHLGRARLIDNVEVIRSFQ